MTPCEKLGYKVGDLFITTEDAVTIEPGTLVKLYFDDGTNMPKFEVLLGQRSGSPVLHHMWDYLRAVRSVTPKERMHHLLTGSWE